MSSVFITGGCGFIGCMTAAAFIKKGWSVTLYDNLSRSGTETNLQWLKQQGNFNFINADVRNYDKLSEVLKANQFSYVIHLAAQVAVTTSVTNPREDFEINALGTFNVLEAIRNFSPGSFLLFASTNKVYGKLDYLRVEERNNRYGYATSEKGVSEGCNLDFHSPYGCSKGAADQYVVDYARIYGLNTCVFRQSCIYGIRQFGIEDQGWVAWFTIAAVLNKKIYVYGDGKQVRDALYVGDLVEAYIQAYEHRDKTSGQVFNIGGGAENTLSLLELLSSLENKLGRNIPFHYGDWRPGDQKVFVCDISKFSKTTGWRPATAPSKGVDILIDWVVENKKLLESVLK